MLQQANMRKMQLFIKHVTYGYIYIHGHTFLLSHTADYQMHL